MVDGKPSERGGKLAPAKAWVPAEGWKRLMTELAQPSSDDLFLVRRKEGDQGKLFHHRRRLGDGQILFLVNTSIEHPSAGTFQASAGSVERWNLQTGAAENCPFNAMALGPAKVVAVSFELPPCGSLLLFLSNVPLEPREAVAEKVTEIKPAGEPQIRPVAPNVLVLDYVDITAGGETKKNVYVYQAGQFAFQKNGLPRNPWDSAVQFKNELISKKLPAGGGFEASYRFTIAGDPPAQLSIVIERPDLYTITCNGQTVSATKGEWWLDKAFGKIDISKTAKGGENVVTLKAAPFTIYHELESAYLLGEFMLKPAEKGFVVVPDQPLKLGKWNEQGRPFYSAGASYTEKFNVSSPTGRYRVGLTSWYGSVARVTVNGKDAGRIFHAPWECDVTGAVKAGENVVEVTVVGTLKNTLGPHHGNPPLGAAWPNMFHQGPENGPPVGTAYSTVGYGLFEPFVVRQVE